MATSIPTRWLLWAGIVGPIGFVVTFVLEGATRAGYDPVRHFVSLLSLGDGGWVQVANFLVTGVLIAAFGFGIGRRWSAGPGSRWASRWLVMTGVGLIVSGAFATDPALGYPAGAPAGIPTTASWHASLHYLGAVMVFLGIALTAFVAARRARVDGRPGFAAYAAASGTVTLAGWVAPFVLAAGAGGIGIAGLLQRIAVVAGWQLFVVLAIIELGITARSVVVARS